MGRGLHEDEKPLLSASILLLIKCGIKSLLLSPLQGWAVSQARKWFLACQSLAMHPHLLLSPWCLIKTSVSLTNDHFQVLGGEIHPFVKSSRMSHPHCLSPWDVYYLLKWGCQQVCRVGFVYLKEVFCLTTPLIPIFSLNLTLVTDVPLCAGPREILVVNLKASWPEHKRNLIPLFLLSRVLMRTCVCGEAGVSESV